jgi:hypothetical protein
LSYQKTKDLFDILRRGTVEDGDVGVMTEKGWFELETPFVD